VEILNKIINFEIEKVEFVEQNPNSQFSLAKIQAFASGMNRHDMVCPEEVLKKNSFNYL